MNDLDESVVRKLTEVYEEEEALYREFVSISGELAELAGKEVGPGEIDRLVSAREARLKRIAELEGSIAPEKGIWERHRGELPGDSRGLKDMLDRIRGLIEQSLALDKRIEADIRRRLGSLKSDLDHIHRTRQAQKAYLRRDDRRQTGITRARA